MKVLIILIFNWKVEINAINIRFLILRATSLLQKHEAYIQSNELNDQHLKRTYRKRTININVHAYINIYRIIYTIIIHYSIVKYMHTYINDNSFHRNLNLT